MADDGFVVGKIPAGSIVLRQASADDLREDCSRIALYKDDHNYHYWLCWGDRHVACNPDG